MTVYKAINMVQADLAKTGITKDRKNQQQGFMFRGIDDVYNVLSPLLSKHGLCILPRMLSRQCAERQTARGGTLFYVTVEAEFDFVCAEDGSKHTVKTFGEAMDSGDKATNKAMSAAYKYAAFQAFGIPTEGDNDSDATTHEPIPNKKAIGKPANQKPQQQIKNQDEKPPVNIKAIQPWLNRLDEFKVGVHTSDQLDKQWRAAHDRLTKLSPADQAYLTAKFEEKLEIMEGIK